MAKYFIHNGEQASIIAELPAGWTALEVNSAERSAAIDPLENVDVTGAPSVILEVEDYKFIKTDEEKITRWKCLFVDNAVAWSDMEAAITTYYADGEERHTREKTEIAAIEAAM
tara:strand:- start:91 stop:432 length:342 start_codon:yes stop_codon:yes gene_type:complete